MKRIFIICLFLTILGTSLARVPGAVIPFADASLDSFWIKFRIAVITGDREAVASLSQFPIGMPYGLSEVKNRAQLLKRYREVFNGDSDAAKCFRKARPQSESGKPGEFSVGCKNAAGEEVVIYWFRRTKNGWRFTGVDNINE